MWRMPTERVVESFSKGKSEEPTEKGKRGHLQKFLPASWRRRPPLGCSSTTSSSVPRKRRQSWSAAVLRESHASSVQWRRKSRMTSRPSGARNGDGLAKARSAMENHMRCRNALWSLRIRRMEKGSRLRRKRSRLLQQFLLHSGERKAMGMDQNKKKRIPVGRCASHQQHD